MFDPNPVVGLRDNTLREPGVDPAGVDTDLNDAKLTAALMALPIRDVSLPELFAGRLSVRGQRAGPGAAAADGRLLVHA